MFLFDHKYTWTTAGGKTRNQIDHIAIDRKWHYSIFDVNLSGDMTVILSLCGGCKS